MVDEGQRGCYQFYCLGSIIFLSHWDFGCHNLLAWCNGFTPDITVNTYCELCLHWYFEEPDDAIMTMIDQYKQDIQRIKAMGVNTLSFSISWSRIFPFGLANSPVNEEGVSFVSGVRYSIYSKS
jgi:beta-glucosidase